MLSAPNAEQTDLINKLTGQNLDASSLAASFENLFCLPDSAKYVPIYEHVLTSAKEINGRFEFDSRISAEASQAIEAEFDKRGFGWHKFVKDMPTVGGTMSRIMKDSFCSSSLLWLRPHIRPRKPGVSWPAGFLR